MFNAGNIYFSHFDTAAICNAGNEYVSPKMFKEMPDP